jgi:hypothetical protein
MGITPFQHVALMAHRAETQWPPTYPRRGTLLTPSNAPAIPRDAWGADEWKAYALFLEEAGGMMARRLHRTQEELRQARTKLTRRRKPVLFPNWISDPPPPKKRGRKPANHTRQIAESVLAIRAEFAGSGRRLTDRQALAEHYKREGKRSIRASEKPARHVLNVVSQLRKRQVNSTN